jgi:hypothetical protein
VLPACFQTLSPKGVLPNGGGGANYTSLEGYVLLSHGVHSPPTPGFCACKVTWLACQPLYRSSLGNLLALSLRAWCPQTDFGAVVSLNPVHPLSSVACSKVAAAQPPRHAANQRLCKQARPSSDYHAIQVIWVPHPTKCLTRSGARAAKASDNLLGSSNLKLALGFTGLSHDGGSKGPR